MAALRVAIIGSGPSAFYAADPLLKQGALVDMFERLPTPYGLVRGGVAPDHPKIKSVTKLYERIAAQSGIRYFGNIEFGRDLLHEDLPHYYDAVIYATGAQTDKRMGIDGEDLPGSHAATEFVGWYNGHPDYRDLQFDLSQQAAAVIGNGNVAMDVARILARTPEELASTDIADYALEALRHSQIRTVYVLGRRGPAQAAFTTPEIKELGELSDADVVVLPKEAMLDEQSLAALHSENDRTAEGNVATIVHYAETPTTGKPRQIVMRFLVSPLRIIGADCVEAIEIVHNELVLSQDGTLRPRATDEKETLPVGLVFRSIGYKGVALAGVPFDARNGVIPNDHGRVTGEDGQALTGEYVVGWIKRGPSGIIGTNKPDSLETVTLLLEDAAANKHWSPDKTDVEALLRERGAEPVSFADWLLLDHDEIAHGETSRRPRVKYTRVDEMLAALHAAKGESAGE